jgi:multicomponent Na+:H+ antiporter subunit D
MEMMTSFPIAFIYILGALLVLILPRQVRSAVFLVITALAFFLLIGLESGATFTFRFLSYDLVLTRVDGLSLVFAYVMVIMSFLGGVYSYHVKDRLQQVSALFYIGSSLGVIFAGDLLTVVVYWEIMAVASLMLIWARHTHESRRAGFRYLLVHAFGGSLLMAGVLLHYTQTGSLAFGLFEGGTSSCLILTAFAVNAAIPPLNAWMPDAYPESTVTGTVFLSAFTSKVAVYALARGFAGEEILIWAGVIMALYGTVYALMQNDIRRLLAYSIIAQIGYMVAAIGIGTDAAISGASAHAFTHILYKALLLMVAGTILYSTGRSKLTELGGLARAMPLALAFYAVGALAISGVPLFSGYVSKSLITGSIHAQHLDIAVLLLLAATFGTFLHTGLKLPYYTWFGTDQKINPSPVPVNQYIGMALTAIPCVAIGVYPPLLLNLLPYPVEIHIYSTAHVLEVVQLLALAGVTFWLFKGMLRGREKLILDTDWLYRRPSQFAYTVFSVWVHKVFVVAGEISLNFIRFVIQVGSNPPGSLDIAIKNILSSFLHRGERATGIPPYNPDMYRISLGIMLLVIMIFFVALLALVSFAA